MRRFRLTLEASAERLESVRARAAIVLVTLLAVAAVPATASAGRSRDWSVRLFAAPDGGSIRFTTIAEDGAAAGTKSLADGTPKAVYFNGRRLQDLSGRLGVVSSITGLNDRHQAAGYASSNPAARAANLFDPSADASVIPRAFFLSGRTLKRLSMPSVAFGINISGDVVGTFRAQDGLLHAFLWRPGSKGDRRFADLGGGDARALSDPVVPRRGRGRRGARAAAVQSLMTIVGGNSVWQLNIVTGRLTRRLLAPDVFLQSVSNTGLASGGRDLSDMARAALLYDVGRRVLRALNLPDGRSSGFASGISRSTGLMSGSASSDVDQQGVLWRSGGSIFGVPDSLPGVALPPGTTITNVPAVSDTGLFAGFATTPTGEQQGVVVAPSPLTKEPLLLKAWDAYVDQWGSGGSGATVRRFRTEVGEALDHWQRSRRKSACRSLREAAIALAGVSKENYDVELDVLVTDKNLAVAEGEKIARPALAIEVKSAFAEFADELGCPGFKKALGLTR